MVIGIDNVNLIEAVDEPYSHHVSDSLHARHSPLGWIISGYVLENGEDY